MKYPVLATLIRTARQAKELTLNELASKVDVHLRTVIAWERGTSRPRENVFGSLASVLGINEEVLRQAVKNTSVSLAQGSPRLRVLPLGQLSEEEFEAFVRDLYRALQPTWDVTRNGSSGHKQYGIDVYASGGNERVGIQCKHRKQFGPADIERVITEVTTEAAITSGVIALSLDTATPQARTKMREYPDWRLWDGEDLAANVRDLPLEKQLSLIARYFPNAQQEFLGIAGPSPWLTLEELDASFATSSYTYKYKYDLIGRSDELAQLISLVDDHEPVIFLIGRGGIGKTRLLAELAESPHEREVRFLAPTSITPDMFELLPEGDPIIIIDDALSLGTDLEFILTKIPSLRPDATVILSARPKARSELLSRLSMTNVGAEKVTVQVSELTIPEAEQLACLALKDQHPDSLVEMLALAGYDCPLVIVIGAHLVHEGYIKADTFISQQELRQEVLNLYTDALMKDHESGIVQEVLQAVATIQPVKLDDAGFVSALCALVEKPLGAVLQTLDLLEERGLMMRRRQSVRIVPDLLGEAILERALVSRSGIDTRWSQKVTDSVKDVALTNAIRNVSFIDWYRRASSDSQLANSLWASLDSAVLELSNTERKSLVHSVASVAGVYPARALGLARTIMEHPAPDEPDPLASLTGRPDYVTASATNHDLSPLIRNAAVSSEYVAEAMELLWKISQGTESPHRDASRNAFTTLEKLGEYQPNKHLKFYETYVHTIHTWLKNREIKQHHPRIVELLKPILALEVSWTRSKGPTLITNRYQIDFETVRRLRLTVIGIAHTMLKGEGKTAAAAISVLEEAIRTAGRHTRAEQEMRTLFEPLRNIISEPAINSSVRMSAYRALEFPAKHAEGLIRNDARAIREQIYIDSDLKVVHLLRPGWRKFSEDEDARFIPTRNSDANISNPLVNTVKTVLEVWQKTLLDSELLGKLERLLQSELEVTGAMPTSTLFLRTFFELKPALAVEALEDLTRESEALAIIQEAALVHLFENDHPAGEYSADKLMKLNSASRVVNAISSYRGSIRGVVKSSIHELLKLTDPYIFVRLLKLSRWWQRAEREVITWILRKAPIESESTVARAAADALAHGSALPWKDLAKPERTNLLARFAKTPNIDSYEFSTLLNQEIELDARQALDFLLQRLDHSETRDFSYRAIPLDTGEPLEFRKTPGYRELVAELVEALLLSEHRLLHSSEIFNRVVVTLSAEVLEVLMEQIQSGERERIALAADQLQHANQLFVIENPEFVEESIRASQSMDEELGRKLMYALHTPAWSGFRSRAIGVDDPEELKLRDQAQALAMNYPEESSLRSFYTEVSRLASQRIQDERDDDKSVWELRRW